MKKVMHYIQYLQNRIRSSRRTFAFYSVLRALVILCAVRQLFWRNYEAFALCLLSLFLFLIPSFMEDHFKIEIPPLFEGIIYGFIFAAEILGEVDHFYIAIPGWDTMLHTLNGFLCAAIGFSMIDLLNRHSARVNLSPFYLVMVAFCFSMTVGVIWEFIEFAGDQFFGQDMQKDFIVRSFQSVTLDPTHQQRPFPVRDITETIIRTAHGDITVEGGYLDIGIIDTMKDLLVNFLGAIIFSVCGYFYCIDRGKRQSMSAKIAAGMMVRVAQEQNDPMEEPGRNVAEESDGRTYKEKSADRTAADREDGGRSRL